MAELTPKERLQPSLLDRLTDNEPDQQKEAREKRVLSMRKLRESVQRDLAWLLNTSNLETVQDLDEYPLVSHSVINYGLPDLAGRQGTLAESGGNLLETIVAIHDMRRLLEKLIGLSPIADSKAMLYSAGTEATECAMALMRLR